MDLTRNEKKLLTRGLKAIQADRDFKVSLQREIWSHKTRRERVATKLREGLLQAAFRVADIDQAAIARRQDLDRRSALGHLEALMPKVNAHSRSTRLGHADRIAMLKSLARSKRLPHLLPAPPAPPPPAPPAPRPEIVILTRADSVSVASGAASSEAKAFELLPSPNGSSISGTTSLAPWNNTLRTDLGSSNRDGSNFDLRCDFSFLYRPSRSGVLHAWAWVASNGVVQWATDARCETIALVQAGGWASMALQQPSASGIINQIALLEQPLGPEVHEGSMSNCSSDSGARPYDRFLSFETSTMELPVVANAPVQVVVSIVLQGFVFSANCTFDFATGSRQINVPAVILNLT
jgi:hypothetical protein